MKKRVVWMLLVCVMTVGMLAGCGKGNKTDSMVPIVDITMKESNDELKDRFGDDYDASDYKDGKTTLTAKAGDIDVTVHLNWSDDKIKNMWMEAVTTKDNYEDFEKLFTDFYSDLELQNQADVVKNGMTTYKDVDISYVHFIDLGNTFLYVGDEEAEKEEYSESKKEASETTEKETTEKDTTEN